jgi:hypothetical protein
MGVLNHHEEGPAPRQRFKLMQQGSNSISRLRFGLRLSSSAVLGNDSSSANSAISFSPRALGASNLRNFTSL